MRVIFSDDFDYVTLRTANGKPRAMVAYKASPEPVTVKNDHGEAAIKAGAATEVKEPAKRASAVVNMVDAKLTE